MNSQGKVSKDKSTCGYDDEPRDSCEAFCTQIPLTDKCETIRWDANSGPVQGMSPCTDTAMTYTDISGFVNVCCSSDSLSENECASKEDIHFVDSRFSRCQSPNQEACPYTSSKYPCPYLFQCSGTPEEIEGSSNPPSQCCPNTPNRGSEGYPAFFTDQRVPLHANAHCQVACACNKNTGFGPPSCFDPGQPYPGPLDHCYCDGHNIAYDKTKFDQCGYYLPIFGIGVLPGQYESYANAADADTCGSNTNGLVNNFPEPMECVPIDPPPAPPSPSGPPSWWNTCANQGGSCPTGCGSCKEPQPGSACMCSDSPFVTCTAECGYGQN